MSLFLEFQVGVLLQKNAVEIDSLERQLLEKSCERGIYANMMEAEMDSWSASWRQESLDHYIPQGWSFSVRGKEVDSLQGYFLAQPILFFQKQTQTLWVEHLNALSVKAEECLIDVAYRQSREKHLQRVYFNGISPDSSAAKIIVERFSGRPWSENSYYIQLGKGR